MTKFIPENIKRRYWKFRGTFRDYWDAYKPLKDYAIYPQDTIIVAGSGRSGTTWLGSVIAKVVKARPIFEPFILSDKNDFILFRKRRFNSSLKGQALMNCSFYLPVQAENEFCPILISQLEKILSGRLRSSWSDADSCCKVSYEKLLIKAVRANLMLGYIANRWEKIKIIWIVRDPVQVIKSQIIASLQHEWGFDFATDCLLMQKRLLKDWLGPFVGTLSDAKTLTEKLTHRWCIENYVPYQQNIHSNRNVLLVFYDNLINKKVEWHRIFRFLGIKDIGNLYKNYLQKKSKTFLKYDRLDTEILLKKAGFNYDLIRQIIKLYGMDQLVQGRCSTFPRREK